MSKTIEQIDKQIADCRKEIDRLQQLQASRDSGKSPKYRRRLGSGNSSIASLIARQERIIQLLEVDKTEKEGAR